MRALSITLAAAATMFALTSEAQIRLGDGQLSGSFETTTIYYIADDGLDTELPNGDHFGTNNYLKLDYNYKRFSAGVQVDAYLPALDGYEIGTYGKHNFYLSSKYVQWQDKNYNILVGDIFDQYGNGLIYRSFEDRQLGFNNSIEGVRASYNFSDYVTLKAMYGRPRLYTDYAESWVRGADLSVSLNEILGMEKVMLSLEGSYVNRFEALDKDDYRDFEVFGLTSPNLNMYSGRVNFDWNGLSLNGEYVHKSKDMTNEMPMAEEGKAILGQVNYNIKGFSVSGTYRRLENMGTMLTLYGEGTGNTLNYLPALTRQYTYLLANLNPYQVQAMGEEGGQLDLYYSMRSKQDRRRYWNFHANFSTYYSLDKIDNGDRKLFWRDINVDAERQWNKSWKTIFLYSRQEFLVHNTDPETCVSDIFVADVTHKFNRKHSLRFELQYLLSNDYEGDWMAALVEYNISPRWSIFASDMYNHGDTKQSTGIHYYNGGFSYTKNRTRLQLSYGRTRAGYVCSGGVCRWSPAYTGVNLVLTSSF